MTIVELFTAIKNTSGSKAKQELLAANLTQFVDEIFDATYGDHQYYVTKLERDHREDDFGDLTIDEGWPKFYMALQLCEHRKVTGNDARELLNSVMDLFTLESQAILYGVLQHNLKIGLSGSSFLKTKGKKNEEYEVSLAKKLNDAKNVNPVDGTWFASRKLDGCRCTAWVEVKENEHGVLRASEPIFKSRQNKIFQTLDNLKPVVQILADFIETPGTYVFDGEICILDEKGDEHFDWVMKEINRKDHTIANPCYNIFDFLTEDEFYERTVSPIFSDRLIRLEKVYDACNCNLADEDAEIKAPVSYDDFFNRVRLLNQERLISQDDFGRWQGYVRDGNWEGFMLRKDVAYEKGCTSNLLKVKLMQDAEYVVIGTKTGKVTYNEDGQKEFDACTALIIEHKGNTVQVGSGLSKAQRLRWFDHPEEIVGKTITVQYFEETMDKKTEQYSLRFPVLKYVYENGRDC